MLSAIHPNILIALLTIVCGFIFGIALAFSDWRSKLTKSGIITAIGGFISTLTIEKVNSFKLFLNEQKLLNPILWGLNIAFIVFIVILLLATLTVFSINFIKNKRADDPEAFVKATRRVLFIFGNGLYYYITAQPDLISKNRIQELEKHIDVLGLLHKTLVTEIREGQHNQQHFKDSIEAVGRLLLQYSFGDTPELQKYRMAFFEKKGDKLEYMVTINNRDWTSHSMKGFEINNSFIGQAISENKPLIYPRDKKLSSHFTKRKKSRYKSFIAVPVPCCQNNITNIGAITVDYTDKDNVFTEIRVDELFMLSQLIHVFYLLNIQRGQDEK